MKRTNLVAAAMGAAAVVGLAVATIGTAHAGTDGQQVRVCINGGDYTQVTLNGVNQNEELAEASGTVGGDGCTSFAGQWWKGNLRVFVKGSSSGTFVDTNNTCAVAFQQEGDWFDCPVNAVTLESTLPQDKERAKP